MQIDTEKARAIAKEILVKNVENYIKCKVKYNMTEPAIINSMI